VSLQFVRVPPPETPAHVNHTYERKEEDGMNNLEIGA